MGRFVEPLPTFYDLFNNPRFAMVRVVKVYEGDYIRRVSRESTSQSYTVAECEVEDGYGKFLGNGTKMRLIIRRSFFGFSEEMILEDGKTVEDFTAAEIEDVLRNSDSLLINLDTLYPSFEYFLNGETGYFPGNDPSLYYINFDEYDLIPINDGRLDVSRIDSIYEKLGITIENVTNYNPRFWEEFDEYFTDVMPVSEIEGSIKRLVNDVNIHKK